MTQVSRTRIEALAALEDAYRKTLLAAHHSPTRCVYVNNLGSEDRAREATERRNTDASTR